MAIKNKAINYRLPLCYEMSSGEVQQIKGVVAQLQRGDLVSDEQFDACLNAFTKRHTATHYTPCDVALQAAQFLCAEVGPGHRILDVGSGVGKFCLMGAALMQDVHFFGIEQRSALCTMADELADQSGLNNVSFLCGNAMNLNFKDYTGFYLYNPFYEHLEPFSAIDETIDLDEEYYHIYCGYVRKQLQGMPKGTRVVTYFGGGEEIPLNYDLVQQSFHNDLKCWQRR
jgi:SAM-dependent methyltransferase